MGEKRVLKPVSSRVESYEIRLDDETFHICFDGEKVTSEPGSTENPDLVLITDRDCFLDLVSYRLNPVQAVESGKCTIKGDIVKLRDCIYYLNRAGE